MDRLTESYRSFRKGDKTAFDCLIEECRQPLIYYLNGLLGNLSDAEDVAMDAFCELLVHPLRYRFQCSIKSYLYTVAHNKAVDLLRRKRQTAPIEEAAFVADSVALEDAVIDTDEKRRLNGILMGLNPEYRECLRLVCLCGLSYDEAAAVMKKSNKQVNNLVYRARQALRAEWKEMEADA